MLPLEKWNYIIENLDEKIVIVKSSHSAEFEAILNATYQNGDFFVATHRCVRVPICGRWENVRILRNKIGIRIYGSNQNIWAEYSLKEGVM